jgi:hypothetical protein
MAGAVAYICNPNYLRGRDYEIMVQGQTGQKVLQTPSQPIKAGHDGGSLLSQLLGKHKRMIVVQALLGINVSFYLKN